MNLATRCPACGTVFRVVPDQLRVSQGWVRCGRCSEAFNAVEAMVEPPSAPLPGMPEDGARAFVSSPLPPTPDPAGTGIPDQPQAPVFTDTPGAGAALEPAAQTAMAVGSTTIPAEAATSDAASPLIELPPGVQLIASDGGIGADRVQASVSGGHNDPNVEPETPVENAGRWDEPVPAVASRAPEEAPAGEGLESRPAAPGGMPLPALIEGGQGMDVLAPSFLVQAERAERWRRPGVRLVLWLLTLIASLGLMAQAGYAFRDRLAATAPALRPLLQQACTSLGCRVGDFRQIDALSVESSGLVRVEGSAVYRLSVTLRNRAALEVAAPAIDLTLTDAQGRPIARRVMQMSDLYLPLRNLKPGSELPIQVPLGVGERTVSGYTVEIFYP